MPRCGKKTVAPEPGIQIVVPFDPQRLSPNLRLHYHERRRRVKHAREAAKLAWLLAGSPRLNAPALVALTVRRTRRLDPDNALAACKAALDELLSTRDGGCGVLPDDSAAWVSYAPVAFETGDRFRGKAQLVVTLTPRGELPP